MRIVLRHRAGFAQVFIAGEGLKVVCAMETAHFLTTAKRIDVIDLLTTCAGFLVLPFDGIEVGPLGGLLLYPKAACGPVL